MAQSEDQKPEAGEPSPAVLAQILAELQEIKELLALFTSDGFPLRASVPSPELLASIMAASSMLSKATPTMTTEDVNARICAAQVFADVILRHHDSYQGAKQNQALQRLAQGG